MSACTCRRNELGGVEWWDHRCPVVEHSSGPDAEVQARDEAEYERAQREWNRDIPRGGL